MSTEHILSVLRAPLISEKAARLQERTNQYVFEVAQNATKADVKAAVEHLFSVNVLAVNVVNVKGKAKSFRSRIGHRGDWRKAYVRLADGQSIDVMARP
ncbi:MAG TPA: 50S ribosomal protein L23 [Aquimonas sp.]|jgi:large subunit ribosomal protein L23|nr:50S ribosomal protein L23 [Xanthomonadales bacterium]HRD73363.1 50S ribosomal protein L23 [Aquimonas sp.]HRF54524.1 50S ribosomal protein L23 [Aquimonas sp.]